MTFVNSGVLGCLGPLEPSLGKVEWPLGFLGSFFEAKEPQGTPSGAGGTTVKFLAFWEG